MAEQLTKNDIGQNGQTSLSRLPTAVPVRLNDIQVEQKEGIFEVVPARMEMLRNATWDNARDIIEKTRKDVYGFSAKLRQMAQKQLENTAVTFPEALEETQARIHAGFTKLHKDIGQFMDLANEKLKLVESPAVDHALFRADLLRHFNGPAQVKHAQKTIETPFEKITFSAESIPSSHAALINELQVQDLQYILIDVYGYDEDKTRQMLLTDLLKEKAEHMSPAPSDPAAYVQVAAYISHVLALMDAGAPDPYHTQGGSYLEIGVLPETIHFTQGLKGDEAVKDVREWQQSKRYLKKDAVLPGETVEDDQPPRYRQLGPQRTSDKFTGTVHIHHGNGDLTELDGEILPHGQKPSLMEAQFAEMRAQANATEQPVASYGFDAAEMKRGLRYMGRGGKDKIHSKLRVSAVPEEWQEQFADVVFELSKDESGTFQVRIVDAPSDSRALLSHVNPEGLKKLASEIWNDPSKLLDLETASIRSVQ